MARRCPRSKPLGPARLMRHRLTAMREGWLNVTRDARASVHGILWDVALADVAALDRFEGVREGLYVKALQSVVTASGAQARACLFRRQCRPGNRARRLSRRGDRGGAPMGTARRGAGESGGFCASMKMGLDRGCSSDPSRGADDMADDRAHAGVYGGIVGDDGALAQDDDAVADREDVGQAMADQDDGDALRSSAGGSGRAHVRSRAPPAPRSARP